MVNHATMDETAKITDLIWHVDSRVLLSLYIWEVDDDGQRGEAEKNNIVLDGTEKLQKQREQRLEARRTRETCHDVYKVATNVVAAEKGS